MPPLGRTSVKLTKPVPTGYSAWSIWATVPSGRATVVTGSWFACHRVSSALRKSLSRASLFSEKPFRSFSAATSPPDSGQMYTTSSPSR